MKRLSIGVVAALATGSLGFAQVVQTVLDHGDPNDVYDIVILAEGYQQSEQTKFDLDVAAVVARMNAAVSFPIDDYIECFNVHSVFRASVESGADDPLNGITRNTVYDCTYNFGGSQRCLYPATGAGLSQAASDAALAPDTDGRVMILVNTNQYGGCASTFSVSFTGLFGPGVQIHEWGHSFAGLADEYSYGGAATYTGSEFSEPNVSNSSTGAKWSQWLGSIGPVSTVGAYQGARYHQFGAYRPEADCMMRNIGLPFCSVCREHLIKTIHAVSNMISDPVGPTTVQRGTIASFSFRNRIATRPFAAQWRVDGGTWMPGVDQFDWDTTPVTEGSHTVEVWLTDISPEVRVAAPGELEEFHSWTITVDPPAALISLTQRGARRAVAGGGDIDGDGDDDVVVGTPDDGVGGSVTAFGGLTLQAIRHWASSVPGEDFGRRVEIVGDVDADGFDDVAIAAIDRVIVYSGASGLELHTMSSGVPGDEFGATIDGGLDANGDGFDDVLVAAPGGSGAVYLFSGFDGSQLDMQVGAGGFARFGVDVCGVGDVTLDGYGDYAVGETSLVSSGAVHVYSGFDGSLVYTVSNPLMTGPRDDFGISLDLISDYNGDTLADIVVGAPLHVGTGMAGGLVTVLEGFSGLPVFYVEGAPGDELGAVVGSAGDLNGDGLTDLAAFRSSFDIGGVLLAGGSGLQLDTISAWQDFASVGDPQGDGFDDLLGAAVVAENAVLINLGMTGTRGRAWTTGAPCVGSDPARRPRLDVVGRPNRGGVVGLRLRGALANASSALAFGVPTSVALDPLGMPGCELLSSLVFASPRTLTSSGASWTSLPMPSGVGLSGVPLSLQWLIIDPGAPGIGLALSDAVTIVVGP